MAALVKLVGVSCRYGSGGATSAAISLPDLHIAVGQHTLLLGPSGSGKTTLINCIAGLQRVSAGRVEVEGTDLAALSTRQRDQLRGARIGMVMQRLHLISAMTVRGNLQLAQRLAGHAVNNTQIESFARELGIVDKLDKFPRQLSQGEAQRAAIARALVNAPALLLADEPTSALDDASCDAAIGLLLQHAQTHNATLIVATHDARIKPRFSNVVHLGTTSGATSGATSAATSGAASGTTSGAA